MDGKQLLVLGCSENKRDTPGLLPAIDRYDSSSYRVLRNFLRKNDWPRNLSVAVLSAKYGLIGGFTGIENYHEQMTRQKALELAPKCQETLKEWSSNHSNFYFSLGKDYLPAIMSAVNSDLRSKVIIFNGSTGTRLNHIKEFLTSISNTPRYRAQVAEPGSGEFKYFLPDWDDLLDENFDFENDAFSAESRKDRNDKHCCILMKPKKMCDGILVSLAQHVRSKGPLRRVIGTESSSLAPKNLREFFGLTNNQILFGDCGAFSYVNDDSPAITVEQAIAMYELYGFDFGASVDHMPVQKIKINGESHILTEKKRLARVEVTKNNAELFINLAKERDVTFIPVGTIQALDAGGYAKLAAIYHEFGYRHLAIGGLVPLSDDLVKEILTKVMGVVSNLNPRPWIHLFGIFRPKLQKFFRELKVDSFDSATYFRKAWLRSDQNYLASNGKWYAALRVPMTKDGRTRRELEEAGFDLLKLQTQEIKVLELLCQYDKDEVGVEEVLDSVIDYDNHLKRSSDVRSLRDKYKRTLEDRPWKKCDCPFCENSGIHVLIFRGSNRNKRRGAHNTLMLYESLKA